MELDRETQLLGAVEDAAHLFDRKRDALAEAVDGIDQTSACACSRPGSTTSVM